MANQNPSLGSHFVLIAAGPFWMGSEHDPEAHPNEKPRNQVALDDFWIGKYPVTNAEYAQFILATNHPSPVHWPDNNPPEDYQNHPIVNVSYHDAVVYCQWLSQYANVNFRLPTEQEWEKAARGTTVYRYAWGEEWHSEYCNTREYGHGGTTPVDKFNKHNKSKYGVIDLLGNVWEWTESWYQPYPGSVYQSAHYGEKYRVVRGGAWNAPKKAARISTRGRYASTAKRPYLGFRLAANPDYNIKDKVALHNLLKKHFNTAEIRILCFALDIQYENLSGDTLDEKEISLIDYAQRHFLENKLRQVGKQQRAELNWDKNFVHTKIKFKGIS